MFSYKPHTDQDFGGDVPITQLPPDFAACVKASASGASSQACDSTVGSQPTGYGYCSQDKYANMTYCACVNAKASTPECVFGPCADSQTAYHTGQMQAVVKDAAKNCPQHVNCAMVRSMGGAGNVASGVSHESHCGGIAAWVAEHQWTLVLVFILLVVVAILVRTKYLPARRRAKEAAAKAPPADGAARPA